MNHATQHRSEVAVMLTPFDHSPGDLDFLIATGAGRQLYPFVDSQITANAATVGAG